MTDMLALPNMKTIMTGCFPLLTSSGFRMPVSLSRPSLSRWFGDGGLPFRQLLGFAALFAGSMQTACQQGLYLCRDGGAWEGLAKQTSKTKPKLQYVPLRPCATLWRGLCNWLLNWLLRHALAPRSQQRTETDYRLQSLPEPDTQLCSRLKSFDFHDTGQWATRGPKCGTTDAGTSLWFSTALPDGQVSSAASSLRSFSHSSRHLYLSAIRCAPLQRCTAHARCHAAYESPQERARAAAAKTPQRKGWLVLRRLVLLEVPGLDVFFRDLWNSHAFLPDKGPEDALALTFCGKCSEAHCQAWERRRAGLLSSGLPT